MKEKMNLLHKKILTGPIQAQKGSIIMKSLKVNVKVNADVRKVLDEMFKDVIEKCPNTISCEDFLARCDSSGKSEELGDVIEEV